MADYGADPLWHRGVDGGGVAMISLDTLPLSTALKSRLRAWAHRYDILMQAGGYAWPDPATKAAWITEGRALLAPVRRELGPGYDVAYFEESD